MRTPHGVAESSRRIRTVRRLARLSLVVMISNLLVILWGAFVRATGSGAGCGSHWPLCNGEVFPRSAEFETLVELTHRLTSGLALGLVLWLVVASFRLRPPGHPVRQGSIWILVFMLAEALVGAGIVLNELVADDSSMARAIVMTVHLLNTFGLLAACTLTTVWAQGQPRFELRRSPRVARWFLLALGGLLLVGTTGAIAALGDTLFPAASFEEAWQQDLSPTSHWLLRLRSLHPAVAVLVGLFLLKLPARIRRTVRFPDPESKQRVQLYGKLLSLTVLLQLMAGTLNIFLLVPIWLQLVHLALADGVWILLVLLAHAVLATAVTEPDAVP